MADLTNFNSNIGNDFMRQEEINILRYLPEFLQKSYTFKTVADAHSAEHKIQFNRLEDLFKQLFVESATWGLTLWEKELFLPVDETDSYENRRQRIWNKLRSKQTSTLQFMTDLLNRYVSTADGTITEKYADYALEYSIPDGTVDNWPDLIAAINQWKPAHLSYYFLTHTDIIDVTYYAGIVTEVEEIYIPCADEYVIETGATKSDYKTEIDYIETLPFR